MTATKPNTPITTATRLDARRYLTAQGVPFRAIAAASLAELSDLIEDDAKRAALCAAPRPAAPTTPAIDVQAIAAAIAAQITPAPAAPSVTADDLTTLAEQLDEVRNYADATNRDHTAKLANLDGVTVSLADRVGLLEHRDKAIQVLNEVIFDGADSLPQIGRRVAALETTGSAALAARIDAIETALTSATPAARARVALAASAAGNPMLSKVAPYYTAGADNAATVCALLSPPSFGKSHTARELGKTYDLFLEHGCSDDLDEISTLLGTITPDGRGGFVQTDGVLTQAVRAAADGQNVLLFLDEIFRLSPRAQEWMLSFLAPSKAGFTLRTRRALPDGTLETLTAPTDRLHILTAANLTQTEPAEAFWSRLHKIRIPFDASALQAIAEQVCASYGITTTKLPAAFAELMDSTRRACKEGALRYPADIRLLSRACAHAGDATEEAVAREISDSLADACALWDGELGDTLPQSVTTCEAHASAFRKTLGL